ncbi:hypothetical protein [Brevundimonas sp.]|uniref:hypothetical protein n=1 Tax=Brevundimonas sp. TaxID=1871086 RepID=UPI0028A03536|nr:hypothetical protein [Brevundimonas sp.]
MATKLNIINLAFAHLGEPLVRDLAGDPPLPSVVKALAQWDQALETALAMAPWLCATISPRLDADLSSAAEAAQDWRYRWRFTCPAGTIKIWSVAGDFAWQAGVVVGADGDVRRVIRADHPGPLMADLIVRRPVEALTPLLADALAWELASRLAGPIQSNEDKAQWAAKQAEKAYVLASSTEATEIGGQEPVIPMGPLAAARLSAP